MPKKEQANHKNTIKVYLRWFSVLAELRGRQTESLAIPLGFTAGDFLEWLVAEWPEFSRYRSSARVAVNQEYVEKHHPLNDGDDIVVMTPVSGG